jgi:nitrogen fixation protein NifU and related proteins
MADLRELYQEVILEHAKAPRNHRVIESATRKAEGYNPLCGDRCTVYLKMRGDVIDDIAFQGSGCAISRASASMMTQGLKGKTAQQAEELFQDFRSVVTGQDEPRDAARFGKLAVFRGVSEFPARVKCATLAWHTLEAALHDEEALVTTET